MWYYRNQSENFTDDDVGDNYGFVYCITNRATGKKYIGKKFFWSKRTLPPLKGKTRKRKKIVMSDWQDYYGSNAELKLLVEKNGTDVYHREILRLCKTKGECSYYEAKLQFENDVLLSDEYYNEFIGCKIHASHVKHLKS
jgi:hypothetical protein